MEPINALRKRAEEKRDFAIQMARQVYQRDLAAIEALDRSLPLQVAPEPEAMQDAKNTISVMRALIQPGKPFTAADMVDWLSAAQPGQSFNPLTVRAYLSRLGSAGEIRKLYQNGKNYARWISAASYDQAPDLERKQLRHLIADILKVAGKPLGVVEITVALRDMGYRVDVTPRTVRKAVSDCLRRLKGHEFERGIDGRWQVRG
jgi:hypothetical protein